MTYDYVACKRSLECMFGLGVLNRIKFLKQVRIVRAQVPPSEEETGHQNYLRQMNSLAASVKLTYSASMVDRLTDFCLKVRHEIGVSSIKVMNPPIDTRSSLFVAKSESE
ncbi:hypothetical protein TNCV_491681 [Trichonephila clavipes]|nr:hypothetical protein TNCV_491681 [Trichonephila clavipes]